MRVLPVATLPRAAGRYRPKPGIRIYRIHRSLHLLLPAAVRGPCPADNPSVALAPQDVAACQEVVETTQAELETLKGREQAIEDRVKEAKKALAKANRQLNVAEKVRRTAALSPLGTGGFWRGRKKEGRSRATMPSVLQTAVDHARGPEPLAGSHKRPKAGGQDST